MTELTPELLLAAYAHGFFPMARDKTSAHIEWFFPEKRGIIPLDQYHIPKSLKKLIHKHTFEVRTNTDFPAVIQACANREETWINAEIISSYCKLWELGFAHSVECWREGKLRGGLYGIALGGAFFGESMFSLESGASKVALAYLLAQLVEKGFILLDTQYINEHLRQFGAQEVPSEQYVELLSNALSRSPLPLF